MFRKIMKRPLVSIKCAISKMNHFCRKLIFIIFNYGRGKAISHLPFGIYTVCGCIVVKCVILRRCRRARTCRGAFLLSRSRGERFGPVTAVTGHSCWPLSYTTVVPFPALWDYFQRDTPRPVLPSHISNGRNARSGYLPRSFKPVCGLSDSFRTPPFLSQCGSLGCRMNWSKTRSCARNGRNLRRWTPQAN